MNPNCFAIASSTIRAGNSLGSIQFFKRCGTTAYLVFGFAAVSAVYTARASRSGGNPLRPSVTIYFQKFSIAPLIRSRLELAQVLGFTLVIHGSINRPWLDDHQINPE